MPELYIGLMSGTSVDAVDAALVDFSNPHKPQLIATHSEPPDAGLRADLLGLSQHASEVSLARLGELDQRVGHWFADAALTLLHKAGASAQDIRAIGSHGQTIHHAPRARYPFTMQIGDPSQIAWRCRIPTIAHMRSADMAAGGQGAPLVPAFHREIFAAPTETRCIVNIGGIANISLLPHANSAPVTGYDTGPGNALMDVWISQQLGATQDTDGQWASQGVVLDTLLTRMLQDPYFQQPAPKSTGREYFNLGWINRYLDNGNSQPPPVDVQATLLELTARSIANAVSASELKVKRVLLCGGGSHNGLLRKRLVALLAACAVRKTDGYGIAADWVEAATFAWLAMRRLNRQPGNLPAVTGATQPVVLGGIYAPLPASTV